MCFTTTIPPVKPVSSVLSCSLHQHVRSLQLPSILNSSQSHHRQSNSHLCHKIPIEHPTSRDFARNTISSFLPLSGLDVTGWCRPQIRPHPNSGRVTFVKATIAPRLNYNLAFSSSTKEYRSTPHIPLFFRAPIVTDQTLWLSSLKHQTKGDRCPHPLSANPCGSATANRPWDPSTHPPELYSITHTLSSHASYQYLSFSLGA